MCVCGWQARKRVQVNSREYLTVQCDSVTLRIVLQMSRVRTLALQSTPGGVVFACFLCKRSLSSLHDRASEGSNVGYGAAPFVVVSTPSCRPYGCCLPVPYACFRRLIASRSPSRRCRSGTTLREGWARGVCRTSERELRRRAGLTLLRQDARIHTFFFFVFCLLSSVFCLADKAVVPLTRFCLFFVVSLL